MIVDVDSDVGDFTVLLSGGICVQSVSEVSPTLDFRVSDINFTQPHCVDQLIAV